MLVDLLCIVCYSTNVGQFGGSALVDELQGHNSVLKDCIEQLTAIESSRTSLVSHLREALEDQVLLRLSLYKIDENNL